MTGTISVLNAGAGDMEFSFDSDDPLEVARAQRCVQDMLARGYMLFAESKDGKLHRIESFDPATNEYIVADGPGDPTQPATKKKPAKKRAKKRVPAKSTKATSVPKTAGG